MRTKKLHFLGLSASLTIAAAGRTAAAAPMNVTGGTAASPVDLTSYLVANEDLQLLNGHFVVRVPVAGSVSTMTAKQANAYASYDLTSYGAGHFVDASTPSIVYRGTIGGTGTIKVTNASGATTNPSGPNSYFTGGLLLFTNPQSFDSGSAEPSLIIDPNTTVAFDKGQAPDSGGSFDPAAGAPRNIVNNGYLYSANNNAAGVQNSWGSITRTVPGAGVVTFENGNVLTNGSTYTGAAYVMNGTHFQQRAVETPDAVVQSNILSFETEGPNYLVGPDAPTTKSVFGGDFYSFGADTQIQGKGIQVFTGIAPPNAGNTKKDFVATSDSLGLSYFVHSYGGFGLVIYIQATLQVGDGRAIVDNGDGTNNTFFQTNLGSVFISTGNFEPTPKSLTDAYHNQALAFDYSGVYKYDACVNAVIDSAKHIAPRVKIGNFVIMNPDVEGSGKAANHLILTCPMLTQGIVQIEANAILELGDGTTGRSEMRSVPYNGGTYSGIYSDSYGNGMVLTRGNSPASLAASETAEFDQIINDGKLIVNNTPGALDIVMGDATIAPLLTANQLDTIIGSGSVEQKGTLPLTLDGESSYTGGTLIDEGATLVVASMTALGARTSVLGDGSGRVVNNGTLRASPKNHVIVIPGDFAQ